MGQKKKFTREYTLKSSPTILYNFLTNPSNMAQWFADEVDITENECVFVWNGAEEKAYIIDQIEDEMVRYRWADSPGDEYFEFRIQKAEVTNDTILVITDFAEDYEMDDQQLLWDSQVETLRQQIGG